MDDVLEFYAAWSPLASPEQYQEARGRVMRLLAGRKALRDFRPARGRAGIPKSSLDGARESVWKDPEKTPELDPELVRRFRLSEGEQLDVVGLVKRLGGGRHGFPSVSRIAADPWLRGLENAAPHQRATLLEACEDLARRNILTRVTWPQFSAFPYEATPVYRDRHKELQQETGCTDADLKRIRNLLKDLPRPDPYLAILVADGDRMGKVISAMSSPAAHRDFSARLSRFAADAKGIVAAHNGSLVYSGGDDVLAFVPVDQCLPCARALHQRFATHAGEATLSVGIAIGHFMEPLEDLLECGRAAEKAAKNPDRDGLAVHLHPRSGPPITVRAQWSNALDESLQSWARLLLARLIPDKAAYDLRELARDYEHWPPGVALANALRSDALRLLKRKRTGWTERALAKIESLVERAASAADLRQIADEIIVARRIASALDQASGGSQ